MSPRVPTTDAKALAIYDLLREAHKSVKRIWTEYPEITDNNDFPGWEMAMDAVDNTLYLAEGFFAETWRK